MSSPQVLIGELFTTIQEDNLSRLQELLTSSPFLQNLSELRHPSSRLSPLHVAAFAGSEQIVSFLLEKDPALLQMVTEDSYNAAHYAASEGQEGALKILLDRGINLHHKTIDFRYKVSGFPILLPGGLTPLHLAAKNDQLACFQLLLQHGADPQSLDRDLNTPLALALLNRSEEVLGWWEGTTGQQLKRPTPEQLARIQGRDLRLLRRRMELGAALRLSGGVGGGEAEWEERRRKREELQAATCQLRSGTPRLTCSNPAFLDRFDGSGLAPGYRSALLAAQLPPDFREEAPGIYSFDLFTPEYCGEFIARVVEMEEKSLVTRQPNSMNRYGCVLDDVGFRPMLEGLVADWVKPLCSRIFPAAGEVDDFYSFTIQYKLGMDVSLDLHRDSSDITINVCLGKIFEGGALYFQGGRSSAFKEYPKAVLDFLDGKEVLNYHHSIGKAVFHLGNHEHGARPIVRGERWNLIIWLKTRRP